MSLEQTQQTIDRYFDLMGRGGDFAECYTPMSLGPRLTLGMKSAARLRFATTLLPYTTTCSTPKPERSSSPMGTHI
jgi:hypothetical protein